MSPVLCPDPTSQVNLPSGPGPEGYPAVLANWRAAWQALRVHTKKDISETNSIHIVNSHLEVKQPILICACFFRLYMKPL